VVGGGVGGGGGCGGCAGVRGGGGGGEELADSTTVFIISVPQ